MNKQVNDNQTIIEDLPVDEAQQDEVKGGVAQTRIKTFTCPSDPTDS